MSGGERPIGTAKGKQSDTEALCQTPLPPDDEMTITKCRPTKVQCSHSPGSLLSETQDEALDVGHCSNPKKM